MKNDTYLNPLQRDYKSEDCNLNSVKREEHVYMELFTIADSRTSLQHVQSGINENEPGAGGELNNINSAIGKPRGSRNRSKIIIAVLVVVTMVAVAVAIFMAIAAAKKDESSDNPGKTICIQYKN